MIKYQNVNRKQFENDGSNRFLVLRQEQFQKLFFHYETVARSMKSTFTASYKRVQLIIDMKNKDVFELNYE